MDVRVELAIGELVLGPGVDARDPRVARAVERAARAALAGRPKARRVDATAIGRAVGQAVAERVSR